MKEVRFFYVPQAADQTELPQDEAVHALRVLRLKEGDEIFLQDGCGMFHRALVTTASAKHCCYEIVDSMPQERMWKGRVHLAIAPTKNIDRMEWMAEKATEVGFDELSFVECQFSERRQLREDRIEKIVVSAMKQSRKAWLPKVNGLMPFRDFVRKPFQGRKFIAHCYEEIPRKDLLAELEASQDAEAVVMVGPEGDFSIDEVRLAMEHGFEPVSLGSSRLRTETAGLMAVTMAHLTKRLFSFLLMLLFTFAVVSCSKSSYQQSLPANSIALMSVSIGETSGVGSNALLKTLLMVNGSNDGGIDVTQKLYAFETADGYLGLCAAVSDVSQLAETLSSLSAKGRCQPLQEKANGSFVSVLDESWTVAFDDHALLIAGPVPAADHQQMQSRLLRYLSQDEERSGAASPLFQKLLSIDAPMALVAQVKALPEQLATPFMLGAPREADASQVVLAAALERKDNYLLMTGETYSPNKSVDAHLQQSNKVFRPLNGRYLPMMAGDAAFGLFVNVDGKQFLPLMQANEGLQTLLAGINAAIDMDNIIKSVDGEMAVVLPTVSKERMNLTMKAELAHSQWLADVGYWKESCPKGSRIDDWNSTGYCYHNASDAFYFGVSGKEFFGATSSLTAANMLKPTRQPVSSVVQQHLKDARLGLVVGIGTQLSDEGLLGQMLPVLKALLGNVDTIAYKSTK